jgi:hypothetical protein
MFTKGQTSGIGAGLLDLSIRGFETKSSVSGLLIFNNFAIISFLLRDNVFAELKQLLPEYVDSREALDYAYGVAELLDGMKEDGSRAIDEMAADLVSESKLISKYEYAIENGESFDARSNARKQLMEAQKRLKDTKNIFIALLFGSGISLNSYISSAHNGADLGEIYDLKNKDNPYIEVVSTIKYDENFDTKVDASEKLDSAALSLWAQAAIAIVSSVILLYIIIKIGSWIHG